MSIPEVKCRFYNCKSNLESSEEIDMELCARHKHEFETKRHYFTVVCWSCGTLVATQNKSQEIQGVVIPSDIIFTQECPHCNQSCSRKRLSFLTISDRAGFDPAVITEKGKLVNMTKNLIVQDTSE